MKLQANWHYPTEITLGAGCIKQLPTECKALGMSKVLLVTDSTIAGLPMVQIARRWCENQGLETGLFSDIEANPTKTNIELGMKIVEEGDYDGVVAIGGGSSLDGGKTIAMMARQGLKLWDLEDKNNNWLRAKVEAMLPVVAIPTTAGTGSEVGRTAVILDDSCQMKKIIYHPNMLAKRVLLDPELTVSLPANITAATGMDALSHNLEAFCAPCYHPMAEGIALEGMRIIKKYLPLAWADGHNIEARTQMLTASCMGATAFQRGLGGIHALAHSLGALYHHHHGLLIGILMPYLLEANRAAIEDKITRLAGYLELPCVSFDGFIAWVLELRKGLGIPHTLAEIYLSDVDAELIGQMSFKDAASKGNPIPLTLEQYTQVFINALCGNLLFSESR